MMDRVVRNGIRCISFRLDWEIIFAVHVTPRTNITRYNYIQNKLRKFTFYYLKIKKRGCLPAPAAAPAAPAAPPRIGRVLGGLLLMGLQQTILLLQQRL